MTIKNITINTILTIALLISHRYAWTMKNDSKKDHRQHIINSGLLGALPSETLKETLSAIRLLESKIMTILALRTTCKKFHTLTFQYIVETCQHHTDDEKETLLNKIANNKVDYWKKRTSFLILSVATNKERLLIDTSHHIVRANDIEAVKILNFNLKKAYELLPFAQTPEMALELCNINNANLKDTINTDTIWKMFTHYNEEALEMLKFYITNNVPLNAIDTQNGNCLLHTLILNIYHIKGFGDKTIKAIKLVINACPELVNVQDYKNQKPKDLALAMRGIAQRNANTCCQPNNHIFLKNCQSPFEEIHKTNVTTYEKVIQTLNKAAGL